MSSPSPIAGSFRDASGFLYRQDGRLYRQVNHAYREHYDHFIDSGLYEELSSQALIVPHEVVDPSLAATDDAYIILAPEEISFVSYPNEWCFSQLKAAALLTLDIQKRALAKGMSLKDASAYNVQFKGSKPVFIDTLSFELQRKGQPWIAYKQFCQHFLAPLLLIAKVDERLIELFETNIDGIPLDLTAQLLPFGTRIRPSIYTHIVLHSRIQRKYADSGGENTPKDREVSELGLRGLIENLESTVRGLEWSHPDSEWGDYYENTNYDENAMSAKEKLVDGYLTRLGPVQRVVDAGANTGRFSAIAARHAESVIALDVDWVAVDKHFNVLQQQDNDKTTPLQIDLTTPTPSFGWANEERQSFSTRAASSVVMALALIHHLAISNNVPLERVASYFHGFAEHLIIEFVPKSDSQVKKLLATREDIFPDYHIEGFEQAFEKHFSIIEKQSVSGSDRTLFLLQAR